MQERLLNLGTWLETNGEAIYGSSPWKVQNDTIPGTWYTTNSRINGTVYAITLSWPYRNVLKLGSSRSLFSSNLTSVNLLGYNSNLTVRRSPFIIFVH